MEPTRICQNALSYAASLMSWKATDNLPAETREAAAMHLQALEQAVQPASARAAAVALEPLISLIDRYGIIPLPSDAEARETELSRIARGYRQDLADLPSDLLALAVRRIVRTHQYRNLPLPAEIRKAVAEEFIYRRAALGRLDSILKFGKFSSPPLAPEDRLTPHQTPEVSRVVTTTATRLTQANKRVGRR
jgi:hypothetical protein